MWPRSHTSGLMIGECTRSQLLVVEVRDQRERALARPSSSAVEGLHGFGVTARLLCERVGGHRLRALYSYELLAPLRVLSPLQALRGGGRGRVVDDHAQALASQQARGHVAARLGRASR